MLVWFLVKTEIKAQHRKEIHYKYHEFDASAHIDTKSLKQEVDFFLMQ